MMIIEHPQAVEGPRDAAIKAAEVVSLSADQRWRLAATNGHRTVLRDIPLAALWIAMAYACLMRMFGQQVALVDWRTVPERVKPLPPAKTDLEILVDRTADLLWANRHCIKVDGSGWNINPKECKTTLSLPGDVVLTITTHLTSLYNPAGPDFGIADRTYLIQAAGISRSVTAKEAYPLDIAWITIVCQGFLDAVEPGSVTLERRSDAIQEATEALCRILERSNPPLQNKSYMALESRYDYTKKKIASPWRLLPENAMFCRTRDQDRDRPVTLISDGRLGVVGVDNDKIADAENRRATHIVEHAIASTIPSIAGPSETGSPKAAMLVRLLRDALSKWPDLQDGDGTPIEPLLSTHLPRLLQAYAAEKAVPDFNAKDVEDQLDAGLDRIGAALEEALSLQRDRKRNDLRVEVAFLMSRHPERTFAPMLDS